MITCLYILDLKSLPVRFNPCPPKYNSRNLAEAEHLIQHEFSPLYTPGKRKVSSRTNSFEFQDICWYSLSSALMRFFLFSPFCLRSVCFCVVCLAAVAVGWFSEFVDESFSFWQVLEVNSSSSSCSELKFSFLNSLQISCCETARKLS